MVEFCEDSFGRIQLIRPVDPFDMYAATNSILFQAKAKSVGIGK